MTKAIKASLLLSQMKARSTTRNLATVSLIPIVQGDQLLWRLMLAWAKYPGPFYDPYSENDPECHPNTPVELRCRWLWSLMPTDPIPKWLELAGLPYNEYNHKACMRLVELEAVFPDGHMSQVLEVYMARVIAIDWRAVVPPATEEAEPNDEPEESVLG